MSLWLTMTGDCTQLLCKWHVKRDWRNKIPLCGSKQLQEEVDWALKVILEETSIETFEKMLVGFLRKYEGICPNFFITLITLMLADQKNGPCVTGNLSMQMQILICSLNHSTINLKRFITNECHINE